MKKNSNLMLYRLHKTANFLLLRLRLQQPWIFKRHSTSIERYYAMASRRSSRLSAKSSTVGDNLTNGSIPPKVANTSRKRKNLAQETAETTINGSEAGPSTPKRKKVSKPILPPITPTPSTVGLMSAPYASADSGDMPPPRVNRLAVPNGTNATLVTPETHRVVAAKPLDEISPSKISNVKTTAGILEDALAHLIKVEPLLKPVIDKHYCEVFSPRGLAEKIDPFNSLASGIISQQVSSIFLQCVHMDLSS